jgi:hypothetical protein
VVSATAHTTGVSFMVLKGVSGDRIINCGLWPVHLPDLTTCNDHFWGNLTDKVYRTNPHTKEQSKESMKQF